ncbi:hypothetical protein MKX42_23830 [Paenibacillus sp. FSL R7-0204]|uniref:hypothetical protein n=1 Tax=Paenibacillus sp. FSL R7-0204 TaxID=2921675 RepID=UPI0030F61A04
MFDGSMYLELNLKPWRGSRVWKLIKYIKRNKKELKRDKDQIIYFLSQGDEQAANHGRYSALQSIQTYMNILFEIKKEDKINFKKKLFSANRISMFVEFLQYQITSIEKEVVICEKLIINDGVHHYFEPYINARLEVYNEILEIVLLGQIKDEDEIYGFDEEDEF